MLAAGGEALEYTVSHLAQRVFDARPENIYNIWKAVEKSKCLIGSLKKDYGANMLFKATVYDSRYIL